MNKLFVYFLNLLQPDSKEKWEKREKDRELEWLRGEEDRKREWEFWENNKRGVKR